MGLDKWDVIIPHMGNCLQSVLSVPLEGWDISAERQHLWQRWAIYSRSVLRPTDFRLWGRYLYTRQVRSGNSDFQENPVIESKLKRLTCTSVTEGAPHS